MNDRHYPTTARARKRCPSCGKMVERDTPCVARTFTRETSWGFMPGGYIGPRSHRVTHLYHPDCAAQARELR